MKNFKKEIEVGKDREIVQEEHGRKEHTGRLDGKKQVKNRRVEGKSLYKGY